MLPLALQEHVLHIEWLQQQHLQHHGHTSFSALLGLRNSRHSHLVKGWSAIKVHSHSEVRARQMASCACLAVHHVINIAAAGLLHCSTAYVNTRKFATILYNGTTLQYSTLRRQKPNHQVAGSQHSHTNQLHHQMYQTEEHEGS